MTHEQPPHTASVDIRRLLEPRSDKNVWEITQRILLEIAALSIWTYGLIQVFVANTDDLLLAYLPASIHWMVNFKLLLFLAVASVLWLLIGTSKFVLSFIYVALFPLALTFFRLPVFLYRKKSWVLVLFATNSVVAFVSNLKFSLIFATVFLCALAVALFSHNREILIVAAIVLLALNFVAFGRSFVAALSNSTLYKLYAKLFQKWRKNANNSFVLDEELRNLPVADMSPQQLEVWKSRLQSSVLFNRICLFAATRLEEYQSSGWRVIPGVFALCGLIGFTVISFGGINWAINKFDAHQFTVLRPDSIFAFMYYSFNIQIFSSSPDVIAIGLLSQILSMVQSALSLFVGVILATLIVSDRSQRTSRELKQAIVELHSEADDMQGLIRSEFRMSNITDALEHLREAKSDIVQILYWLTKNLNETKR